MTTVRLPEPRDDADQASAGAASDEPQKEAGLIGRTVGARYRVVREIGKGGMGVVYEGLHVDLDRKVALKILNPSYARDSETLRRFEREAKTAAKIGHPNVVSVMDLGRLESGEPFLVMELLSGHDLESVLQQKGRLPPGEVMKVLEPLAAALDALHAEGIVHRDLKPANVFFSVDARGQTTLKLVDFGLAALAEQTRDRLTREGHVVGTAQYLPPEAAVGEVPGAPGDVYSLAVLAYELLSGVTPHDGMPVQVLVDKVGSAAPSLFKRTGRRWPDAIEKAFVRALDREPELRPASASEFVGELRDALAAVAVAAVSGDQDSPQGAARPAASAEPSDALASETAPATERAEPASTAPDEVVAAPRQDAESTDRIPGLAPNRSRKVLVGAALVALLLLLGIGGWRLFGGGAPEPVADSAAGTSEPIASVEARLAELPPPGTEVPVVVAAPEVVEAPTVVAAAAPPVTSEERPGRPRGGRSAPAGSGAPERVEPAAAAPAERVESGATPPVAERVEPADPIRRDDPDSAARAAAMVRDAQSAMLRGEVARARDLFRDATSTSASSAAAWRGLGLASERLGQRPEARRAYERYLRLAPGAADAETVRTRLAALGE